MKITKEQGRACIDAMKVLDGDFVGPIRPPAWSAAKQLLQSQDSGMLSINEALTLYAMCAAIAVVKP